VIAKYHVRRILDAVLLLPARAPPGDVARSRWLAANIKVGVYQDDRRAMLGGFNGSGSPWRRRRPPRRPPLCPNARPRLRLGFLGAKAVRAAAPTPTAVVLTNLAATSFLSLLIAFHANTSRAAYSPLYRVAFHRCAASLTLLSSFSVR